MIYKLRTKSEELSILEILNKRMNLPRKDKHHYYNLKKGYEGEVRFDSLTEKFQSECLILNDLLLEINHTTFQIDSLMITQGKLYIYEVKNFEGDFYYESDKLFKKPKLEVINPLHQLSRTESLLYQLLLNCGIKLQIDANIVFIHPNFTLYEAPLDQPIIFPTQLNQYIEDFNAMPTKLTEKHKKIAEQLLSLNITHSPFKQVPSYEYDQLKKGITCPRCHSFAVSVVKRTTCICHECEYEEPVTDAVMRAVKEFNTLFPSEKTTTNIIHDWCQIVQSKKTIRRILATHFNIVGTRQWTYYE